MNPGHFLTATVVLLCLYFLQHAFFITGAIYFKWLGMKTLGGEKVYFEGSFFGREFEASTFRNVFDKRFAYGVNELFGYRWIQFGNVIIKILIKRS